MNSISMRLVYCLSFISILLLASCVVQKETGTLIDATQQDWSGGIPGHYGSSYNFTIEFPTIKTTPVPDTVWINGHFFKLDTAGNVTMKISRSAGKITYYIKVGFSINDMQNPAASQGKDPSLKPAPRKYKGAALISYHQENSSKREYYIVPEIKIMTPVNYP